MFLKNDKNKKEKEFLFEILNKKKSYKYLLENKNLNETELNKELNEYCSNFFNYDKNKFIYTIKLNEKIIGFLSLKNKNNNFIIENLFFSNENVNINNSLNLLLNLKSLTNSKIIFCKKKSETFNFNYKDFFKENSNFLELNLTLYKNLNLNSLKEIPPEVVLNYIEENFKNKNNYIFDEKLYKKIKIPDDLLLKMIYLKIIFPKNITLLIYKYLLQIL